MQIDNLPRQADITSDRNNPSDMIDPITIAKDKVSPIKGVKKKKVDKTLFDQISNKESSSAESEEDGDKRSFSSDLFDESEMSSLLKPKSKRRVP